MNATFRFLQKAASAGIVPFLVFGALSVPAVSGLFGITPLTAFAEEEPDFPDIPTDQPQTGIPYDDVPQIIQPATGEGDDITDPLVLGDSCSGHG